MVMGFIEGHTRLLSCDESNGETQSVSRFCTKRRRINNYLYPQEDRQEKQSQPDKRLSEFFRHFISLENKIIVKCRGATDYELDSPSQNTTPCWCNWVGFGLQRTSVFLPLRIPHRLWHRVLPALRAHVARVWRPVLRWHNSNNEKTKQQRQHNKQQQRATNKQNFAHFVIHLKIEKGR